MYHYLLILYEQWCENKSDAEIYNEGESFIELVHKMIGYNKDGVRQFLVKQPWFVSKTGLS